MKGKIKISFEAGEVVIEGDRDGLKRISEFCETLRNLSGSEAKTPANHYHIASYMGNAEEDSLPLVIYYNPEL